MPRPSRFAVGAIHGQLTAVCRTDEHKALYRCTCGQLKETRVQHVLSGKVVSCGCFRAKQAAESLKQRNTKHAMYGTRPHTVWRGMLTRCGNKNAKSFEAYGGRGITVAPEWQSFDTFYADMGEPPHGKSLDRIDNNRGYSKDNCRWATASEQSLNRRSNVRLTFQGKTQTATEWSKQLGMPRQIIYSRKRLAWTDERTLSAPARVRK